MHKLLQRQIRRIPSHEATVPEPFLRAVDAAYAQADEDRRLLERAIELTSEELLERNEALNRSLSLLQATLEATEDGILVVDRDRRIESYNQRFVALWSHPTDILDRGDGRASIQHASTQVVDADHFKARVNELYDEPNGVAVDKIEMLDGRLIERYTRPMIHHGEILGRVWSFRDLTEKRHLEEQIRQSQKMEAIGQLAGGIAHDFNNLLTVITGACNLSLRRVDHPEQLTTLLGEIQAAARRAGDLTSQLLSFSRSSVIATESLAVDEAIDDLSAMLQRLIRENITLNTRLGASGAHILADRSRFQQILLNLVINASDALRDGGEILIHTAIIDGPCPAECAEDSKSPEPAGPGPTRHVQLTVRDDGPGIPQEIQARILEPFFTTKPQGQGTGLGLATVYGIVGQFGGTLEIESTPGEGAAFRIALPLTEEQASTPAPQPKEQPALAGTILAVEDDHAVRLILAEMLALLDDCEVHVVDSPLAALEKFGGDDAPTLDCLVSDIVMPDMYGFELARRLAERHRELRVLFISGYDPTSTDWSQQESRRAKFLPKPFDWPTLEHTLRETLNSPQPYLPPEPGKDSAKTDSE